MKEYRDHYFLKAKQENYPARSVYKLKEIADADEGAAVEKDSAASGIALGLAQCVQIDGVLYFDTGSAVDSPPDRGADGVIETSVDRDAFPETDGCSNFGTGYSYWVTEDGVVIVEIDGAYWEFMAN